MELDKYIRDIPDFPGKGIIFKDITPLLGNPEALKMAYGRLLGFAQDLPIDKVVGVDSRGFIFAPMLAAGLGAGFVPVRKKGKLPFSTISQSYGLEYGTDVLEMHTDAIERGDKVLVHDDVLATGGTAEAVCTLVEQLGGEVVQCNFLIQLHFLNGAEKLANYPIKSLLQY
ncbi:MAG: adenine phosphoribosyltransferase [Flavobacteriaceae bacterium]